MQYQPREDTQRDTTQPLDYEAPDIVSVVRLTDLVQGGSGPVTDGDGLGPLT